MLEFYQFINSFLFRFIYSILNFVQFNFYPEILYLYFISGICIVALKALLAEMPIDEGVVFRHATAALFSQDWLDHGVVGWVVEKRWRISFICSTSTYTMFRCFVLIIAPHLHTHVINEYEREINVKNRHSHLELQANYST